MNKIIEKYKGKKLHDIVKDVPEISKSKEIDSLLDILFKNDLYVCFYCDIIVDVDEIPDFELCKCNKCIEKEK